MTIDMPLKHSFYFRILDFILVLAISQGIPNNNNRMENGFMLAAGSVKSRIYVTDLVSGNIIRTFATKTATGVIVDEQRQVAYIAQFFERNIFRFCLQRCQDNEKIINTGDGQPEHVVVDFSTGNVYFSAITIQGSRESSFIGVIQPDKLFQRRIITGIMFWSDYGDNIIERISMDGTNRRVIIRNANSVGLAIDYIVDTLYYGDFGRSEISIANFDGIKIRTIVRDSEIEDVLVNGPHVYYTRLNRRPAIVKVLKESGRVVPFLNNATDTVNERCADRNGLCSGLCLPTPEGRTCACQDGVDLLEDGITCEGERSILC
ncbi:hypothetical protein KUTeg_021653 [Tegillarca granosa]|uniref:Uncharacterized protein n=1 Tax=Tegillarca granosa TaxID=220873 RepID=A0ABQ9E731_TEGGR|nr:hypothetical protein KUTeg_021653 [Tegillarca granosa]